MAVVSNPASFSSLRAACTAEGRGSSTNLGAYYRGGSHVPSSASSGISTTAAGLQLSQFNGVTIPAIIVNHTSSINSAFASGSCSRIGAGSCTATTGPASAITVSNGVGPFTYSWAYVSGSTFTVNSSTSSSTTFSKTAAASPDPGTDYNGVYRCTITDTGNSNYQTTNDVNVSTNHNWST